MYAPAGMPRHTVNAAGYTADFPEPRPATAPPDGQKRFSVIVDGPSATELAKVWADVCQSAAANGDGAGSGGPLEFKTIYPFLTTVQGNRFRFRGGDPAAMSQNLDRLLKARMTKAVSTRVEA